MANDRLRPKVRKLPSRVLLFAFLGALSWATAVGRADSAQDGGLQFPAKLPALPTTPSPTNPPAGAPPAQVKSPKKPAKVRTRRRAAPRTKKAANPIPTPSRIERRLVLTGLRDPFRLPPPPGRPGENYTVEELKGPMPPGTRGLVINQLKLQGVVRLDLSNSMIAVIVPVYANRAYFLRENDAVYNGVVSKITPDSIYFKENFLDRYGRAQVREVVKRLGSASGEGR